MGTKCSGCDAVLYDISYMECSKEKCRKLFHLKCLAMSVATFESLTEEYKKQWMCPECVSLNPRKDNTNTPVRNTIMNQTFTPGCNVNTARGNRLQADISLMETDNKISDELREFRAEIMTRFDNQEAAYKQLLDELVKNQSELQELRRSFAIAFQEAKKVTVLEDEIKVLKSRNEYLESCFSSMNSNKGKIGISNKKSEPLSFASVTKTKVQEVVAPSCGAMKQATVPAMAKPLQQENEVIRLDCTLKDVEVAENKKEENSWTEVRRKNRFSNSEIKRGGSVISTDIEGTERKKYLHVWRLKKETATENLEAYVKKICGKECPLKVEKINHKTERDYASFRIGVPESHYDKLCQSDVWPVNVEFCEWIWFRKTQDAKKISP
ncbi:uncharacterized protein LOC128675163 [Plodia interpunctella]|uniref:uncharacterized protein LOC128675147 n=2 Tax=Plodia interpunctella TaxID=58824 RepID=UPI00236849C0|nr:uncharacterized protein LOC128671030 [Plodia interpunctella]XP_053603106.1 uncharacterized protein LOC128671030 [Plodia interpunctella]XP_053610304.1 uncharacterized protein LOC128675147 [Plodia interpunctella]XP_053610305.1 uncharacterized protein LOC128675147 [Plodia interpunctella]XP_053610342.1 uncharacterized protein LOC128675163 [Plodia interpunctella]XP_053610343.1 uncharacterized protein LOC128675163 [Plodia interpunctella]